jgi:hypothetical protein
MLGRRHSAESLKKMSESNKGRRKGSDISNSTPVLDLGTGEVYETQAAAAIANQIHPKTLNQYLHGKIKNPTRLVLLKEALLSGVALPPASDEGSGDKPPTTANTACCESPLGAPRCVGGEPLRTAPSP